MTYSGNERSHPDVSVIREPWFDIVASQKQQITRTSKGQQSRPLVSVFGGSAVKPGSDYWNAAEQIGSEIAKLGGIVISGGYGGIMEAASKGCAEAGVEPVGVVCHNLLDSQPNPYLKHVWDLDRWDQRLFALVWLSDSYVVMPGSSGTLVELSMVIETQNKGFLPKRKTVCYGDYWQHVVGSIDGADEIVTISDSVDEIAKIVTE